mmetsp:Transcript_52363/g.95785  ORF Transcript_52363/g.95785 Transcript_52363/m.95785 type:complete len:171 (-) Transcript_52363:536-1048(-)
MDDADVCCTEGETGLDTAAEAEAPFGFAEADNSTNAATPLAETLGIVRLTTPGELQAVVGLVAGAVLLLEDSVVLITAGESSKASALSIACSTRNREAGDVAPINSGKVARLRDTGEREPAYAVGTSSCSTSLESGGPRESTGLRLSRLLMTAELNAALTDGFLASRSRR